MTSFVIIKRFEPTFSISLPNECTNYYHMRRKIVKKANDLCKMWVTGCGLKCELGAERV